MFNIICRLIEKPHINNMSLNHILTIPYLDYYRLKLVLSKTAKLHSVSNIIELNNRCHYRMYISAYWLKNKASKEK